MGQSGRIEYKSGLYLPIQAMNAARLAANEYRSHLVCQT
jgi:hypothetical protein